MIQAIAKSSRQRLYQLVNGTIVLVAGRKLPVIHVVEYPKCGGSWIRNMLQSYLGGREYLFDRIVSRNTVIQLHRLYRRMYCNALVVLRDPRDAYVSYYYHERRCISEGKKLAIAKYFQHDPKRPLREDFSLYLGAKLTHRTEPRFSYGEFVESWVDRPKVCCARYEDFLNDAESEFIRVLKFFGITMNVQRVHDVLSYHSFEAETRRRYGHARKPGQEDSSKFQRKGISGDWRNHFNAESCMLIEEHEGRSMKQLGYVSDPSWVAEFLGSNDVALASKHYTA